MTRGRSASGSRRWHGTLPNSRDVRGIVDELVLRKERIHADDKRFVARFNIKVRGD
jgi:hypothetical protein